MQETLAGQDASHSAARLAEASDRFFVTKNFQLVSGEVLPELTIAYITLGKLDVAGRNAILMTHGYTSSHRLLKEDESEASEGGYNLLVGPGRPVDTDRYFVVSSNMLGSSFGSTGPASINPENGKPYGPSFPAISIEDIVNAQHALLQHLGINHLHAVIGASLGGMQALQWAESFPDSMSGIVVAMSSIWPPAAQEPPEAIYRRFEKNPNWNGGRFYETGGVYEDLLALRVQTLRNYGAESRLMTLMPDVNDREAALHRLAAPWARKFDPHSLVILLKAISAGSIAANLARINAKVFYVLSTTDRYFPASMAPKVLSAFRNAGVDVTYFELDSPNGHQASHVDADKWAPHLRRFLAAL